ncbi:MAG: hypothetical protein ACYCTH_00035 [Cellulomonas sp.]
MRRLTRFQMAAPAVVLVAGWISVTAPAAFAAGGATCASYNERGICIVWSDSPADLGSGGSGGNSGGGSTGIPLIEVDGHTCLPAGLADPQPAQTEPVWEGHADGAIYLCEVPTKVIPGGGVVMPMTLRYWALSAPVAPDPEVLAQQAVESMELRAVQIGIAPEASAGSVGLVGVPNWMWVADPTATTFGPTSASASAGGWTVTATARVSQVVWDMGDGQVITCGAGTPYDASYGMADSPDCGHTYTRQGTYPVTATSHWVVTWSGIGDAGTITLDLTQGATVTIGEAQVVAR